MRPRLVQSCHSAGAPADSGAGQKHLFRFSLTDNKAAIGGRAMGFPLGERQVARIVRHVLAALLMVGLGACAGNGSLGRSQGAAQQPGQDSPRDRVGEDDGSTIWDLFTNADDPNVTIQVNKYIWNAALDVLSFLPVEAADPFSGVIVMGWGRAKGASRAYRATVYIQDPALDARALRVALVSRAGPAPKDTIRAIEDAILTRARQMRIADSKL